MQTLDKRTSDACVYDINCAAILDPAEIITSVSSITADQGGLTFGVVTVNPTAIAYPDGSTAAVGKVVQMQISGGAIPAGSPFLLCMVRVHLVTSVNLSLEATVQLRLIDNPVF